MICHLQNDYGEVFFRSKPNHQQSTRDRNEVYDNIIAASGRKYFFIQSHINLKLNEQRLWKNN